MLMRKEKTQVYFVRHAQADLSIKDECLRPLTATGLADSKKVTIALQDKGISAIYSSPYKRSIETITDLANKTGLDIILQDDFRERSIGRWVEDFQTFAQRQWEDRRYKLTGGESLAEVQNRNIRALTRLLNTHRQKKLVIGTHGTALSTIIDFYDSSFGYQGFQSIVDKMPYILHFQFMQGDLQFIEVIDLD